MAQKIVGFHAIEEGLKSAGRSSTLYLERGAGARVRKIEIAAEANGKVIIKKVAKGELDTLAGRDDHRGALLVLSEKAGQRGPKYRDLASFVDQLEADDKAVALILDGITDVQNLGAILRSADQFAVSAVLLPERRSAQINPTVVKVSSGAAHWVPVIRVVNLNREIEYLKEHGFWVYGASLGGESLYETRFPERTALVMGSEGKGLAQRTEALCDHVVTIPTAGHIDSLNVSVATGVLLYEIQKQHAGA